MPDHTSIEHEQTSTRTKNISGNVVRYKIVQRYSILVSRFIFYFPFAKIEILVKVETWVKDRNFGVKSKFGSKIEIVV